MKNFLKQKTQEIREESQRIVHATNILKINWSLLESIISDINHRPNSINTATNSSDYSLDRQLGLILLYGAVHYCFVNPYSKKEYSYTSEGHVYKRSTGFITALNKSNINWENFESVNTLSLEKWFEILQTQNEDDLFELNKRHQRIINFSKYLLQCGFQTSHSFFSTVKTANDLIELLVDSKLFEDFFLKRAQVTSTLISSTLSFYHQTALPDINLLTGMPDYRLPQLFYNLKLIVLDSNLENKLRNKEIIQPNSIEEISLRAATVFIIQKMATKLNKPECEVDSLLWSLSQEKIKEGLMNIPAMMVPTDCY